jgi:hypothetical protein
MYLLERWQPSAHRLYTVSIKPTGTFLQDSLCLTITTILNWKTLQFFKQFLKKGGGNQRRDSAKKSKEGSGKSIDEPTRHKQRFELAGGADLMVQ